MRNFAFARGERGTRVRGVRGTGNGDRYASNNQVSQKSRIFVEATNEIEGRLSMSKGEPS